VTAGCLGSGYLLYKLYNSHTRRLADLERELAHERENDEIIKTQLSSVLIKTDPLDFSSYGFSNGPVLFVLLFRMKAHFESIQMIVDSTTLPHAMQFLSIRISEEIDVSHVMDRLNQGKGMLSPPEKLQLWDELKILSMHCSHLLLLYQILFLTCIFMLFARFHEDGFVSVVCDNA